MRDPREASAIAVEKRRARATVKNALAEGTRDPLEVARRAWDDESSIEATLRMADFIESLRGIGPTKSERILTELGIHPRKRLGFLGVRQITALGQWLRNRPSASDIPTGKLIVVAGPTAVGKGTVVARIRALHPEVRFSVSATTRQPRPGEVDGVHYFFVSDAKFDELIATNLMLEWALVHGQNRYGTPRQPIDDALRAGHSIILEIDIQGARQVKTAMPEAILVFLLPPSWDELVRRLTTRGTETAEEQARRLETAKVEFEAQDEFDVTIVNDDVDTAAEAVVSLMSIG
ncbi:MAG: guanylate kinase kinase/integration host factor fusion protein [Actinomycetota bacterium]